MYYDWNICTPHQELLPQGHSQTLRKHVATHGASAHSARMQQIQTNKRTRKISLALMKVNGLPIQAPSTPSQSVCTAITARLVQDERAAPAITYTASPCDLPYFVRMAKLNNVISAKALNCLVDSDEVAHRCPAKCTHLNRYLNPEQQVLTHMVSNLKLLSKASVLVALLRIVRDCNSPCKACLGLRCCYSLATVTLFGEVHLRARFESCYFSGSLTVCV
eukprot:scaffold7247_cov484-Prasinococcus_capsulatus_cf.AAC.8